MFEKKKDEKWFIHKWMKEHNKKSITLEELEQILEEYKVWKEKCEKEPENKECK